MDPILPCIAECLDLLGLTRYMCGHAILYPKLFRGPLKVRIELDSVGWINIYALNLSTKPLPLGERCHHRKTIAEYHTVRPICIVSVELRPVGVWNSIEVREDL